MPDSHASPFAYLPHTERDRQEMLKSIGVRAFEELLAHIPEEIRIKDLALKPGLSELELRDEIGRLAEKNVPSTQQTTFLGGGSYRRFVPAVVSAIVSRSEFATAYTPYQPEVSQGSLQAIYEFQTAVCLLTGMDVANASMYDGPTAAAEAALMASRLTGRQRMVVSAAVNPEYKLVTTTYARSCGLPLAVAPVRDGVTDPAALGLDDDTAAVIIQYPNFYGCLEDLSAIEKAARKRGALFIVVSEPISLGLLKPPGEFGADIVVGDAQPCGNSLSFGGPSAGYMATRQEYVRQLPGRLAGVTVDNRGQRAFTLTLQTREQHIRRAKATSNICTNQALNALTMLVYLTLLGPAGLKELSEISVRRAHYLADKLTQIAGVRLSFPAPYFNEFVVETPLPAAAVLARLRGEGILGGIDLGMVDPGMDDKLLVAVTEMNHPSELDDYAEALARVVAGVDAPQVLAGSRKGKS